MLGTLTIALVAAIAVPNFARAHTTANPLTGSTLSGANKHALVNPKAQFYRLIQNADGQAQK